MRGPKFIMILTALETCKSIENTIKKTTIYIGKCHRPQRNINLIVYYGENKPKRIYSLE